MCILDLKWIRLYFTEKVQETGVPPIFPVQLPRLSKRTENWNRRVGQRGGEVILSERGGRTLGVCPARTVARAHGKLDVDFVAGCGVSWPSGRASM